MRRATKINPGKALGIVPTPADISRLFARIELDVASGCWCWRGCCDQQGYGQIRIQGKTYWVHRVVYALLKSRKLAGVEVDHDHRRCSHRNCCNPQHLRRSSPIANRSNTRRHVPEFCAAPF